MRAPARARLAVGVACVAVAAAYFVYEIPKVARSTNASANSYKPDPTGRLVRSGDILGISRDLQLQALALIPPGSTYALLLPADPNVAANVYGIATITAETIGPFLNYLLLPSTAVDPAQARYVICWGCDTAPWDHRTSWLFRSDQGVAIGQVQGR